MSRKRDIAFGKHSKIPNCCIIFYVYEWGPNFESKWRETAYDKAINESNYNYVPCPKCFYAGIKVKIVDCMTECKRECWRDF